MKTHTILLASLAIALASPCLLAQDDKGYVGPGSTPNGYVTVQTAISADDGKDVILRGHLVRQLDDERYLFDDGTGQVTVKIDKDTWKKHEQADANTPVELKGEVEVHHKMVTIDVKKVRVLAAQK